MLLVGLRGDAHFSMVHAATFCRQKEELSATHAASRIYANDTSLLIKLTMGACDPIDPPFTPPSHPQGMYEG
jgi:hypothetical protein